MRDHPMGKRKVWLALAVLLFSSCLVGVLAFPSGNGYPPVFTRKGRNWYDSFGIVRNEWSGEDGYLPRIINESLGENRELAYRFGQLFVDRYPNRNERAEAILRFVQTWTEYGYDEEHVFMEGISQDEWAWNPDEMAHMVDQAQKSQQAAYGDCEDFGFFCGVLYLAAGYEVTIVHPEGHIALLIWLPDYPDANTYWDVDDGKGYGWIWVEATGDKNPLGWTPPDYDDGSFEVYYVKDLIPSGVVKVEFYPAAPSLTDDVTVKATVEGDNVEVSEVSLSYRSDESENPTSPWEKTPMEVWGVMFTRQLSPNRTEATQWNSTWRQPT